MSKTLGYGEITVTNMTEPFTVILTNEAQQFATDSNRKVVSAQSYYTDIIVMRGSQERTDYTIGNVTSANGITVSKSAKRVTFSVAVGTVISADAGTITIPITLDGQTVNKTFSWSLGKQGPQGVKGEDGADGSNFSWNLAKGTSNEWSTAYSSFTGGINICLGVARVYTQGLVAGDKVTVCLLYKYTNIVAASGHSTNVGVQGYGNVTLWNSGNFTGSSPIHPTGSGEYEFLYTFTLTSDQIKNSYFSVNIRHDYIQSGSVQFKGFKVEKGTVATPWSPHPDDLIGEQGKSVSGVKEYYLATSASSGVTYSTSGWSTDPTTQKLTPTNKYLWNCKITEYDDGTKSQPTTPVICGTYGDTGKNALQSNRNYTGTYTTVGATATTETSSFNRTPIVGDVYTCLDGSSNTGTWQVTAISGTTVTIKLLGYVRSKGDKGNDGFSPKATISKSNGTTTISIVDASGTHTSTVNDGANGTPGAPGKDGKTPYEHVKYSNDGGKTFTGNSGEDTGSYMGRYTDYTEADSTKVSDYTWIKVKGDKGDAGKDGVNGTNLWINPLFESDQQQITSIVSGVTAPNGAKVNILNARDHHNNATSFPVFPQHKYRITVYRKRIQGDLTLSAGIWYTGQSSGNAFDTYVYASSTKSLSDNWEEATYNFTVPDGKSKGCVFFQIEQASTGGSTTWYIANVICTDITGLQGTSVTITSKSVTYQTSTSGTTTPTGTWQSSVPTVANGQYLWTKTTVQYSDGNKTEAYGVSYKGTNGQNGTSVTVSKNEVTYQVSTSGTTTPTGTWSSTLPSYDKGQYLWTKTYVKYSDGKETTSYSVSYKGKDGIDGQDGDNFAWNAINGSSFLYKSLPNNVNFTMCTVNNVASTAFTENGLHYTATASNGAPNSSRGIKINSSVLGLQIGDSITFGCDLKGKFGSSNNGICLMYATKTNDAFYGAVINSTGADVHPTTIHDWTRKSRTFKIASDIKIETDGTFYLYFFFGGGTGSEVDVYVRNIKLEKGTTPTPWSPSQSDIEGRGVSETIQYYLATSAASGVTSSTSGWSTDISTQKITASKKYLWNCYQTKYTDGTSEPVSTPTIIGVYGDKGETGVSTKILRTSYSCSQSDVDKYSKSGYSGTWGVSDSTNGLKVGDNVLLKVKNTTKNSDCLIFAQITKLVSEYQVTCTSYGAIDNGADGEDGAGFHWNLISNSDYLGTYTYPTSSISDHWTCKTPVLNGDTYTLSFDAKSTVAGDKIRVHFYSPSNITSVVGSQGQKGTATDGLCDFTLSTTLERYWVTYKIPANGNASRYIILARMGSKDWSSGVISGTGTVTVGNPKLEEGDKASPWCTTYEETLAKSISITPSAQIFKSTDGGHTFAPNQITLTPTLQGAITFGKWQYSIDGGVSFTDVVSGQKGLTVSNNVLTVAKTSALYSDTVTMVTFRAVASDSSFYDVCSIAKLYDVTDIGDGRNLLLNSNFADADTPINNNVNSWGFHTRNTNIAATIDKSVKHNGFNTLKAVSAANGDKNSGNDLEWYAYGISEVTSDDRHKQEANYTLSFYAKSSVATQFIVRWGYDSYGDDTTVTLSTDWKRYEIKLHRALTSYSRTIIFKLLTASTVYFSEVKLEKGSSATGWSPAPEDVQTAILSNKSSISDVSLKVKEQDNVIEGKVSKQTYETDLKLVKSDLSKANDGLGKWKYEIYPKSLFDSADQGKCTLDVFANNKNLTPSQVVLLDDTKLSTGMDYGDNHIAYAVTFVRMTAKKDITTKMYNDDGASFYVNGKLVGSYSCNYTTGNDVSFTLASGWNCLEVVLNEGNGSEGFKFSTTISTLSECEIMNCYYATVTGRESKITNQLVQNTTDISGITNTVSDVMTAVGNSGKIKEFKSNYSQWKQSVDKIESNVSKTYVTNDTFNNLEIGGRNLLLNSAFKKDTTSWTNWGTPATRELVNADGKTWMHIVGNKQNYQGINQWTQTGSIKAGDQITFSVRVKGGSNNQKFSMGIHWLDGNGNILDQSWGYFIIGTTDSVCVWRTTASGANCSKLNLMVGVSDTSAVYDVYFTELKLEKGNKATDYTPAPEDSEIDGQNLISNLPANWEQASVNVSEGKTYAEIKSVMATRLRPKELIPVSDDIVISAVTTQNSAKEALTYYLCLFDANKKSLGSTKDFTWNSTFPRTVNVGDAKYIAIILRWGNGNTVMNPSDISNICLKIERGTSATPFTLAPTDVNGKIVNVESVATQTAEKFNWLVKSGTSSSNFELTDRTATLVAEKINLNGLVTFSGLNTDAQKKINSIDTKAGNAQKSIDNLEIGGQNLIRRDGLGHHNETSYTYDENTDTYTIVSPAGSNTWGYGLAVKRTDTHKYVTVPYGKTYILSFEVKVPQVLSVVPDINNYPVGGDSWGGNDNDNTSSRTISNNKDIPANTWTKVTVKWENTNSSNTKKLDLYDCTSLGLYTNGCSSAVTWYIRNVKGEIGNKASAWSASPYDTLLDAKTYSKSAVEWVSNNGKNAESAATWVSTNGTNTNTMYTMLSKWAKGAVSADTKINGGLIETDTILARSIALGDFTNLCDDPDFENGVYSPTGTFSLSTEQKYVGTKSLKMASGTKSYNSTAISPSFYLEKDEEVYVEYYVYRNGANHPAGVCLYSSASDYGSVVYDIIGQSFPSANITDKTWTKTSYVGKANRSGMWNACFKHGSDTALTGDWYLDHVTIRKRATGKLIVDGSITANKISVSSLFAQNIVGTGTISSNNYATNSSGAVTAGSRWTLSTGAFSSPNLKWDASGNITAKGGYIGKYKITDQWLITGSGSTCTGIGGNQAFWAGAESSNSAPFRVSYDGKLVASNATLTGADVSGKITASNGEIAGWKLSETGLYNNKNTPFDITKHNAKALANTQTESNTFFGVSTISTYDKTIVKRPVDLSDQSTMVDVHNVNATVISNGVINLYSSAYSDQITFGTYGLVLQGNKLAFQTYDDNGKQSLIDKDRTLIQPLSMSTPNLYSNYLNVHGSVIADYLSISGNSAVGGNLEVDGEVSVKGKLLTANKIKEDGEFLSAKYAFSDHNHWDLIGGSYRVGIGSSTARFCTYNTSDNNAANKKLSLGDSNALWTRVYAANATISTSDERLKEAISPQDERYETLFDNLQPVTYRWKNEGSEQGHDRVHTGFISQQVKSAMDQAGLSDKEFAAFCYDDFTDDPEWTPESTDGMTDKYSLAYEEFISLNTHMIQKTRKENAELKERLKALEDKVAKLNL